ncbi:HNH endonuclease-domain-containing protein [Tuber indicum]|nr:HNH endonuclease-domain-containing protein [Tuber indicum]
MSSNRSHFRHVQFYDPSSSDSNALGGFIQNGSVTEANFLHMLGIVLVVEAPILAQHRISGHVVSGINSRLAVGTYDIHCDSPVQLSNEPWIHRVILYNVSGREDTFRDGIRARDGRCVISGAINMSAPFRWASFEAAHVFPLGSKNLWIERGYGQYVTDMDDTVGVSNINSCQNGFLLSQHIHGLFDQYLLSVNPVSGGRNKWRYCS